MINLTQLLKVSVFMILINCSSSDHTEQINISQKDTSSIQTSLTQGKVSNTLDNIAPSETPSKNDEETSKNMQEDCVRGQATPIAQNTKCYQYHFWLSEDSITGYEVFFLDPTKKIKIKNTGCEYYNLIFEFGFVSDERDTTDHAFWLQKALQTFDQLTLEAPVDIDGGQEALQDILQSYSDPEAEPYELETPMDLLGSGFPETVTFDRVYRALDSTIVQLTFSLGPL